jgi:uncharacterized cupredoxin-like copper-binding protein
MMTKKILISLLVCFSLGATTLAVRAHQQSHKNHDAMPKEQKEWGIGGDAKAVTRTIEVTMLDTMRFMPAQITVKQGETVRLRVKNVGKVMHELVIGTKQELDTHAEMMKKHPNMEHDEPYMAHVSPAKSAEIIWNFNRAGDFDFACLLPGHYEAGMVGKIAVIAGAK